MKLIWTIVSSDGMFSADQEERWINQALYPRLTVKITCIGKPFSRKIEQWYFPPFSEASSFLDKIIFAQKVTPFTELGY